jgi:ADP-ribose pyrophosphatase
LPEREPRTVFTHPLHPTVLEEDLRLPNGHSLTWLRYADHREGVSSPDGVMVICQRDDFVLLSRQYNPGAGKVVWEFAGGGTNQGESYEEAARRETMEEVGLNPLHLRPLGRFLLQNRRSSWGIRVYLGTDLEENALEPDIAELIEAVFIPVPDVDAMIVRGEIDNVTALAGWALFRAAAEAE